MNTEQKVNELMRMTGKGKIACGLCLQLSGGDMEKAIERMKMSYPNMEVKE